MKSQKNEKLILAIAIDRQVQITAAALVPKHSGQYETVSLAPERRAFDEHRPRLPQIASAIADYLEANPEASRPDLVSLSTIGIVNHNKLEWMSVPRNDWERDDFSEGVAFRSLFRKTPLLRDIDARKDKFLRVSNDCPAVAVAEGVWGRAANLNAVPNASFAEIIVGSGVNAAIVANGRPVLGRCNPELGHVIPQLHPKDAAEFPKRRPRFEGMCSVHRWKDRWCLEGLIGSNTFKDREWIDRLRVDKREQACEELLGFYLSQLCAFLVLASAPLRIVVAGARTTDKVLASIREHLPSWIGKYPSYAELEDLEGFIQPTAFDDLDAAQMAGAILLGRQFLLDPALTIERPN